MYQCLINSKLTQYCLFIEKNGVQRVQRVFNKYDWLRG